MYRIEKALTKLKETSRDLIKEQLEVLLVRKVIKCIKLNKFRTDLSFFESKIGKSSNNKIITNENGDE
ncbi:MULTISPECIES: hypothetical protein [Bacillus]|uniref:hypothetical protein n=1 Tax=Bacillus TaxID=1386 RepID=UPI000779DC28|nr:MULTISPECIES: hypothetical protein [Bacillus]MBS2762939.1 hypothetical protein [Bacillus licheniformis]MEC2289339.1 hypothetical protein [Bacillus licheniformis]MED4325868.1 hypothetical protein [Bacillus licheniformis]MED4336373.1 hypothetical protein [Bacillus licheniformis]MED4340204.1 hypothetical protein [Bacillus licheniformis]